MTHDPTVAAPSHPYDSLTPDTILDAMEEAGFAVSGRLFALNSYENRVYQVGLDEGAPVITKFYRPGRWSEAEIREEHTFTLELLEADIPVVAPMKLATGDTLGRHGEFLFAVFPQRGGQAPDTSVTDTLYRLGQWLGQIHNIGAKNITIPKWVRTNRNIFMARLNVCQWHSKITFSTFDTNSF